MKLLNFQANDPKNKFRVKRFAIFREMLDQVLSRQPECKIIDIGGTAAYWKTFGAGIDFSKVKVCLVNIVPGNDCSDGITELAGDARDLSQFSDNSYDIVHSNSVIEHVGRWQDMVNMAKEVRRLAPRYFVQTPYFWFPVEPHARFPLLHWMPEPWRYRVVMRRACGYWQRQDDLGEAVKAVQSAVLLDRRQMQYLFPDATIVPERVFGVTKSLIAMR